MNNAENKIILLLIATVIFSVATFFLKNEVVAGILSIAGILLFLVCERQIENKKDYLWFLLFLWIGLSVRFSSLFRFEFIFVLLTAGLMLLLTVIIGIFINLDKYIEKKKLIILNIFVFPFFYTLIMICLVELGLGNNLNLMTYLMCIKGLGQNITWLSEFGMTFVFSLVISLIAFVFGKQESRTKRICALSSLIIMLVLFVTGKMLLKKEKEADYELKVALATPMELDFYGEDDVSGDEYLKMFETKVKEAVNKEAELLVFSEESLDFDISEYDKCLNEVKEIVKENGIPVVLGLCVSMDNELDINEALFIDENGDVLITYVKNNLVPFIEKGYYVDGEENSEVITYNFNGHEVNLGIVICFDINDSLYINSLSDELELLIVPSWDWDDCNLEQKRTWIRSLEINTTVLKHTYDGFSFVSCPYGFDNNYLDFRNKYEALEIIDVPIYEKN